MFPRAKLQRFNDVTSDVPPPGAYDPKFDTKFRGVGMDKMTERFTEPKPGSGEGALLRTASLNSLPVFRTPQMPKRSVKKAPSSLVKANQDSSGGIEVRRRIENEFSSTEDVNSVEDRAKITALQEQFHQTCLKLEETEAKYKELEKEILDGRRTVELLEADKLDLSKEVDRLIEEVTESNNRISTLTELLTKANADLTERKAAVAELEQSQTGLLLEMEILQTRLNQSKNEMDQSIRRCLELEQCVSEVKSENESLIQTKLSLSDEIDDLTERLNEASMQVQAREEHCETLEHAKRDLLVLVDEKLQALDELTSKIDESAKKSAELEELLTENKMKVSLLEKTNSSLTSDINILREKLAEVTAELNFYQAKCQDLETQVKEYSQNLLDVQDAKSRLAAHTLELEQKLEVISSTLMETEKCLQEHKTLFAQETEAKTALQLEVEELKHFSSELNQKLQQRQKLILDLQSNLSNSSCELEERRAEIERQTREYHAEIEQICAKHKEEIACIKKDLELNIADCEAKLAQAQEEHEYELAKLRDLAYKLEQQVLDERKAYKALLKDFEDEKDQYKQEVNSLTENIHIAAIQKSNLEIALSETQADLQSAQQTHLTLDKKLTEQSKMHSEELSSAQSKLKLAEEALEEEKKKTKELIEEMRLESENRIAVLEQKTRLALDEAELKLQAAEAAYTKILEQVRDETQALVQATRFDSMKELETVKAEAEQKVSKAKEELFVLSNQFEEVQEELRLVTAVRDDLRNSNLDKDSAVVELKDKVNLLETELAQSQKNLDEAQKELEAVKSELDLMIKIRRSLEILGKETLAIINTISQRLLDSDEEVARLSHENCELETAINEQKESLTALEEENIRDILDMKKNLLEKVETFKKKCLDENGRLKGEIQILQESVELYANQLTEAHRDLEMLQKDKEEQAILIANLQQTTNELQATQDFLATQVDDYISVKKSHQAIQKDLSECKDLLEKARIEAADGEVEIQHRERQINDLTNQLDDLNDKVIELQGVILELETAAVESEQEIQRLECEAECQKECILKNEWQINELTRENEDLKLEMDQLKKKADEQKLSATREIEELCAAKAELKSQLDSLNTVLECHKMNVLKATERIETLVNVVAKKESELEEKTSEMNQLKDELLSKTNQLSELSVIISDKDEALLSLHLEADSLRETIKSNEMQMTDLVNDLDFEKAFRKEAELKITEMLQEKLGNEVLIEDFKEKLTELESVLTEKTLLVSMMETKLRDSSDRITLLKSEVEDSLKQITEAEKTIVILEAHKATAESDISSLNDTLCKQRELIQDQNSKLSELNSELQNQADLVKSLKQNIEESQKEVSKLEEVKMCLQNEISSLKTERDSQKNEIISLTAEVEKMKLEVQRKTAVSEEREETLTEEISSLKISLGAKTQEVGTVRGRVQQLESELEMTTRRKETYKAAVVELQQAIKQSRSKISNLENELTITQQKLAQGVDDHAKEVEALRDAAAKGNFWEQRCHELEALVGPFREQLEAFEADRQALALRKEAAEGEVKELADRYAQILGHQNHKQKIHHVIKLKEQILDLKKENDKLESQTRAQKRTIDKLKDELARANGHTRFNPTAAFKPQDDSFQNRLSLAHSKSFLDNSSLSKSFRVPVQQSTAKKGKENVSSFDASTPLSSRTSAKVKEDILSPARHSPSRNSPAGSPATPLKEVQNQQQVN